MSKQAEQEIREAAHYLAEHIMRLPAKRNSLDWLKREMVEILLGNGNIEDLAREYAEEYDYSDVQSPYLVDILKDYDSNS